MSADPIDLGILRRIVKKYGEDHPFFEHKVGNMVLRGRLEEREKAVQFLRDAAEAGGVGGTFSTWVFAAGSLERGDHEESK